MAFGFEITLLTLATGSAYAVLMYVLKREVSTKPVKVATLLTVAFSLLTLSLSHGGFSTMEDSLTTVLLLIAVLAGGSLVFRLNKADAVLDAGQVSYAKNIGVILFAVLTIQWFATLYFLAF